MIFEYLNFEKRYETFINTDTIVLQESTTSNVVGSVKFKSNHETLQFVIEKINETVLPTLLDEILKYFKDSNFKILETYFDYDFEFIEYFHSHNFQMMNENNQFKLSYKPRVQIYEES